MGLDVEARQGRLGVQGGRAQEAERQGGGDRLGMHLRGELWCVVSSVDLSADPSSFLFIVPQHNVVLVFSADLRVVVLRPLRVKRSGSCE